jgi:hypothetical protein
VGVTHGMSVGEGEADLAASMMELRSSSEKCRIVGPQNLPGGRSLYGITRHSFVVGVPRGSRPMARLTDRASASVSRIGGMGHPTESNGIVLRGVVKEVVDGSLRVPATRGAYPPQIPRKTLANWPYGRYDYAKAGGSSTAVCTRPRAPTLKRIEPHHGCPTHILTGCRRPLLHPPRPSSQPVEWKALRRAY